MYKKLNNKEWEEAVNLYYKENKDISIKDYCIKNIILIKVNFFIIKEELIMRNIKELYFKLFT